MRLSFWPSKQQWRKWTLPSKLTALGALLGAIGVVVTLVLYVLAKPSSMTTNVSQQGGQVAHSIVNINSPSPPPALSFLHQIPAPQKHFVGRAKEITESIEAIERSGQGVLIWGMGGVGTEELAKVLADRVKDHFPDGQIFLDLRGASEDDSLKPVTPVEALAHVIHAFIPKERLPEEVGELQGMYHSVLNGKRVLLLMENARDANQLAALTPPPDGCAIIVTSQNNFVLSGMKTIHLDPLLPEEARELLLKICPRIDGDADALADLCGHLPLALRLAASALETRPILGVPDYLEMLSKENRRLAVLDEYKDSTDQVRGINATLGISYRLLNESLQRHWRALAVFPGDFDASAAGSVWQSEKKEAGKALGDLYAASMVFWDEPTERFRLHDLARDYARGRLTDEERAGDAQRHAAHYAAVLRNAQELYLKGGDAIMQGLVLFDLEVGNIRAGQAWAAAHWDSDQSAAVLCNDYPNAGAYCLDLRLHPRERIRWLEAALDAARKLKNREAEGCHLGSLGIAYADLGEPRKAIEYHEQALVIDREIGDRRGEGADLGNMGSAHAALGNPRKAIEFYQQALVIDREIGNRRDEGNTLGNLGIIYKNLGEPGKAIEFYEKSLVIAREIGDRRGKGLVLGKLGSAYATLGEPRKAIEFYEQAIEIARDIGDRRGEWAALGNLGLAYAALGEPRKAMEYYGQALEIDREIGDRHGEATVLYNLAVQLAKTGRHDEAIATAQHAVEICEQSESPLAANARALLEELRK